MLKSMVFIDYQNFVISKREYLLSINETVFNTNYRKLAQELNNKIKLSSVLAKTFLFAYRPCDKLLMVDKYKRYYDWLGSLKDGNYLEVIEGIQEIREIKGITLNINDSSTYNTKEKGTDVNIAVHMLNKAYSNSYDVAILVSGDADYVPVVESIRQMGKIVVLATMPTQSLGKYKGSLDFHVNMNVGLLKNCVPQSSKKSQTRVISE